VVLFLSRSSLLPSVSLLPVSPLLASSQHGYTALIYAAANGHLEAIAALGKLGVNTDAVNKVRAPLGA
jgi:ankyrin repeat protein